MAATAIAQVHLPGNGASAREFVEEAKESFLEECDDQLETERQQLFGRIFEGHQDIVVPQVFNAWCGPRVLTTSWEDGRVVLFDFGCVRVFRPQEVAAFVGLVGAVVAGDEERICASLRGLGAEPDASADAFARVRQLLESFFAPMLTPGSHSVASRVVVDVRQVASDKRAIARMRLPGSLLFLLRIRFGLYSVLARLGSECDWSGIEAGWAEEARERWRGQPQQEAT